MGGEGWWYIWLIICINSWRDWEQSRCCSACNGINGMVFNSWCVLINAHIVVLRLNTHSRSNYYRRVMNTLMRSVIVFNCNSSSWRLVTIFSRICCWPNLIPLISFILSVFNTVRICYFFITLSSVSSRITASCIFGDGGNKPMTYSIVGQK